MAKASVEGSLKDHTHAESSSTAAAVPRNNDPLSINLRSKKGTAELEDIVRLMNVASSSHDVPSTVGTASTAVFSSYEESSGTKPTSLGSSYPVQGKGKGKAPATYASSLSATHGSASEAEATNKDFALNGIGGWTAGTGVTKHVHSLRGDHAGIRLPPRRPNRRFKKPVVIIQNHHDPCPSSSDDEPPTTVNVPHRGSTTKSKKYLRHRNKPISYGTMSLAEEGRAPSNAQHEPPPPTRLPLSRARFYTLIALVVASMLTIALSTFAAYSLGKARVRCTKGIIFSATVLMSVFTVVGMVVARRALLEALLAGLLEFIVGFGLVVEIREFM